MAAVTVAFRPPAQVLKMLARHRQVLVATTRLELEKRYSGSLLGRIWVVAYPLLFLGVYLFLYLVIFKIRLPGFSQLDYVVYIFSGLVPYMALMETATAGAVAIRQNLHLVRNVILPVELIPTRAVGMALVTESVGLVMAVALAGIAGLLSPHLVMLPLAVAVQILFLLGVVLLLSPLGVMLPDIAYFTNLATLFLLFVSPIGFKPEALPQGMGWVIWANPVHYLLSPFRYSLMGDQAVSWGHVAAAVVIAALMFLAGSAFFMRSKPFLLDYE